MSDARDHIARIADAADRRVEAARAVAERSRIRVRVAFLSLVGITALLALVLFRTASLELRQARANAAQLAATERMFRAIAESATDLVRIHALDGHAQYVSPSVKTLLGYTPEEATGMAPFALLAERDREPIRAALRRMFETGEVSEPLRHHLVGKDGTERAFETRVDLVRDAKGRITHYHTIGRDVTARAIEEARLTELATTDTLTGLLNARAFAERGARLLAAWESEGRQALLAFCDVNGLKVINDTLGHDAGDGVIVDAARLLRASSRDTDLVARVGGDEFVVLGLVRDETGALAFAKRLRTAIDGHNADGSRPYRVSISVGTSVFVPGCATSLEALRADADAAMYREKKLRRSAVVSASGESFVRPAKLPD
jgi:diguanylate cyclase (GGDEF)-like protein/PAS domain S-box-containing protein